jgi:hypothetical protein
MPEYASHISRNQTDSGHTENQVGQIETYLITK